MDSCCRELTLECAVVSQAPVGILGCIILGCERLACALQVVQQDPGLYLLYPSSFLPPLPSLQTLSTCGGEGVQNCPLHTLF